MSNKTTLDPKKLEEDYIPIIYELNNETDIMKNKSDPQSSSNIDYPKFSYGFHHYYHQSKDKMEIIDQFENKKKVYLVLNKFERNVDDYEDDIENYSKKYFNISQSMPNILDNSFYKLWEILFMYNIVQTDKSNFTSAHIGEYNGGFIQSTMFYRDKYSKKNVSKNDKYYNIYMDKSTLDDKFIKYYSKEKPTRILELKSNNLNVFNKNKADFITADTWFSWDNENTREQQSFMYILEEIIISLKIQSKGGHFVCKFYESFSNITVKLLSILKTFYKSVNIVKPLMSKLYYSEKYLVCENYNGASNDNINQLETILKNSKNKFVVDIFPKFNIDHDFKTIMIKANTDIANKQFKHINKTVDFIQKQNYRGDLYKESRNMQINASKFWIETFYPNVSNMSNMSNAKKNAENFKSEIIKNNANSINNLSKKII